MEEKKQENWKELIKLHKSHKPPIVPSEREIEIYKEFISSKTDSDTLILGATPQLRDLLHECGYNITLMDFNKESVNLMSEILENDIKDEEIIIEDWLNLDKVNKKFDIILGDHILNNLPLKRYDNVLHKIKNRLKKNGIFVTNIMVSFDEDWDFDKFIDLVNYDKITIKDMEDRMNYVYKICTNDPEIFDKKEQEYDIFRYELGVKKYIDKGKIKAEKAKNLFLNFVDRKICFSMPRADIVEKILKKYFAIIEKKFSKKHEVYKYYMIYKLKPKK